MDSLFIAIDGGGTKTDLVLFDFHGNILKRVLTKGCNPNDFGWQHTEDILRNALGVLMSDMQNAKPEYLFAGISGGTVGNNRAIMAELMKRLVPSVKHISNNSDTVNALSSGIGTKDGCVVISGTGSVGFVRINGEMQRVGGWGYLFDKGGSGYDFGRDAVYYALCALDGRGEPTMLTKLLEEKLGGPVGQTAIDLYQKGKPAIASLAPLVFKAAAAGDSVAKEILSINGSELSKLFNVLSDKIGADICPTVLAGSIFKDWDMLYPYIKPHLLRKHDFIFPDLPPVYGSAVEAAALAGVKADESFKKRFADCLKTCVAEKI